MEHILWDETLSVVLRGGAMYDGEGNRLLHVICPYCQTRHPLVSRSHAQLTKHIRREHGLYAHHMVVKKEKPVKVDKIILMDCLIKK